MKLLINSAKYLLLSVTLCGLMNCTEDSTAEEPESTFTPITLDLGTVSVDVDDTMFEIEGYTFTVERVKSITPSGSGILLAFPDENSAFSTMELDLTNANGLSKITISIFNNCSGCLDFQLLNGNQVVREVKGTEVDSGETDVVLDVNAEITALKIGSLETSISIIRLE